MKEQPLEREIQCHFVLQQLCSMLAVFDLSDEVGRCVGCVAVLEGVFLSSWKYWTISFECLEDLQNGIIL